MGPKKMLNFFDGILKKYAILNQLIKFCMVGALGAVVNYSIFFLLFFYLKFHYIISSGTGFVVSVYTSFFLNKRFTFKIRDSDGMKKTMIKYFSVNIFSMLLGLLALAGFVELLHINVYIANLLTVGFTTSCNFVGSKFFAFRSKSLI